MKLQVSAILMASAIAYPAIGALPTGAPAPDFSAPASLAGKTFTFSLKAALANGPVVVYFFPAAFTGGCNAQAHAFAVKKDKFSATGATVIGVSLDSIARLNDFSADPEYCGGKVPVASDVGGKVARSYDLKVSAAEVGLKDSRGVAIDHGFAERTTFIVTPDGRIAATVGGLSPTANVDAALQTVQRLAGKQ